MNGARRRGAAAILALALGAAGCGYKLAGSNAFLPPSIRIIALTPFDNRTSRPEIEQRVTESVAQELSKRGRYRVVTSASGADALLEGAIADFRTSPVQFSAQGRATRVETVVTLEATLRDLGSGQILWRQNGLLFRQQYDVSETEDDFLDKETLALDGIAKEAAGALVTSILEGF